MKKIKLLISLTLVFIIIVLSGCDHFIYVDYSVVNETGGTLTAFGEGKFVEREMAVFAGTDFEIVFTASPEEGWQVKEWKDRGEIVRDEQGLVYKNLTYTTPGFSIVSVEFERIEIVE